MLPRLEDIIILCQSQINDNLKQLAPSQSKNSRILPFYDSSLIYDLKKKKKKKKGKERNDQINLTASHFTRCLHVGSNEGLDQILLNQ
jgi:hypothetical protein